MSGLITAYARAGWLIQGLVAVHLGAFLVLLATILWSRAESQGRALARILFGAAWLLNAYAVLGRAIEAGRTPVGTLFESLLAFAFLLGLLVLVLERLRRVPVLQLLIQLLILAILGYALLNRDPDVASLPPALRSAWFLPHVTAYFSAYAAISLAALMGCLSLLVPTRREFPVGSLGHRALGAQVLDLELEMLAWNRVGFLLLTLGLITGGLWAKFAWSAAWAWDPKENWGLASWLAYAAILHLDHFRGLRGRSLAWATLAAWGLVIFTYLGMGLLPTRGQSLHVYTQGTGDRVPSPTPTTAPPVP